MIHIEPTRTSLLVALRSDPNSTAWTEFCRQYRPVIVAFAQRLGLAEQDAQDVAQETVVAFLDGLRKGRYDPAKGRLRSWLRAIARNQVRYFYRRNARSKHPAETSTSTGFFEKIPDAHTIAEAWQAEWYHAIIRRCLEHARKQFESSSIRAFELLTLEEKPTEEVAAELGMTPNAALKANRRVMSRLREFHRVLEEEL